MATHGVIFVGATGTVDLLQAHPVICDQYETCAAPRGTMGGESCVWPKLYALHNAKGLNSVRLRVTWGVMVRVHGIELLWVGGLGVRLVGLCLTDLTCELN